MADRPRFLAPTAQAVACGNGAPGFESNPWERLIPGQM